MSTWVAEGKVSAPLLMAAVSLAGGGVSFADDGSTNKHDRPGLR